jgi:hypothetical protein
MESLHALVRSQLHIFTTVNWVKTRCRFSSKDVYQNKPTDLLELSDIHALFSEFDFDKSGTLELDELHQMFKAAGLMAPKETVRKLFTYVKTNRPNEMNRAEFKQLIFDKKEHHKEFLDQLRIIECLKPKMFRKFVPYNMY